MKAAARFPQYIIAHYRGWTEGSDETTIRMVSSHMAEISIVNTSASFIRDGIVLLFGIR